MALMLALSCAAGHVTAFADVERIPETQRSVSVFIATDRHAHYETVTIEDVYEPYLMQIGFLSRTPRGRCVTRLGYDHLGIPYTTKHSENQINLESDPL